MLEPVLMCHSKDLRYHMGDSSDVYLKVLIFFSLGDSSDPRNITIGTYSDQILR